MCFETHSRLLYRILIVAYCILFVWIVCLVIENRRRVYITFYSHIRTISIPFLQLRHCSIALKFICMSTEKYRRAKRIMLAFEIALYIIITTAIIVLMNFVLA